MNKNIYILESLLKVFDANYVSEEEYSIFEGLDVNDHHDLKIACNSFLKEDFLSYTGDEKKEFLATIDFFLANNHGEFKRLLGNLSLAFDNEIANEYLFFSNLIKILSEYMDT